MLVVFGTREDFEFGNSLDFGLVEHILKLLFVVVHGVVDRPTGLQLRRRLLNCVV